MARASATALAVGEFAPEGRAGGVGEPDLLGRVLLHPVTICGFVGGLVFVGGVVELLCRSVSEWIEKRGGGDGYVPLALPRSES